MKTALLLSILRFSPTNLTISDSLPLVLMLNARLDFNCEIMDFQLFLFSFVLVLDRCFTKIKFHHCISSREFLHKGIYL